MFLPNALGNSLQTGLTVLAPRVAGFELCMAAQSKLSRSFASKLIMSQKLSNLFFCFTTIPPVVFACFTLLKRTTTTGYV